MAELITIIGFGSLLSEESARRTCPSLSNFRLGKVYGYGRVFNKVDPNSENLNSENIANWALIDKADNITLVTLFEIDHEDYPAFARREVDYDLRCVKYTELETEIKGEGIACCAFDDDAEFHAYLKDHPIQKERYEARQTGPYKGPVWRSDILPRPKYLAFCLEAARQLGKHYVENILNHAYLADQTTTLGEYLSQNAGKLNYISEMNWLENFVKVRYLKKRET
ncbi:MAG: hypothetical protein ACQEQL_02890 [Pseudomonadota bacterium]